jgi:hypothetical protein
MGLSDGSIGSLGETAARGEGRPIRLIPRDFFEGSEGLVLPPRACNAVDRVNPDQSGLGLGMEGREFLSMAISTSIRLRKVTICSGLYFLMDMTSLAHRERFSLTLADSKKSQARSI